MPPNLAQAPQIFRVITVHKLLNTGQLDTVVLLVVASQMMRGQAPQIFFPRTAPDDRAMRPIYGCSENFRESVSMKAHGCFS